MGPKLIIEDDKSLDFYFFRQKSVEFMLNIWFFPQFEVYQAVLTTQFCH